MRRPSALVAALSLSLVAGCGTEGGASSSQDGGGADGTVGPGDSGNAGPGIDAGPGGPGSEGGSAATTPDASQADASLLDASQADASQADASLLDASQADASQADASLLDASQADASQTDASQADASQTDASQADASLLDASLLDASQADASQADASQPDAGPVWVGDSVLTHHKNPSRDGLYVQPMLTRAAIGTLHVDPNFTATLPAANDAVYAQPLFVDGNGGQDLLVVATEADNVYALDAATGAQVWVKNLGTPLPLSDALCGNIDPLGITGTPVIDLASRTIFLDALTVGTADGGTTPHHQIFALSIDTGNIRAGWPIDAGSVAKSGGTTFSAAPQGQRGALALLGGQLYVPYGGLYGDCGSYHGWVVDVSIANPTSVQSWATTALGGGAWTPGGVSTDGTSLYVSTGNTFGTSGTAWGGGDALIRLSTAPAMTAYFAPKNWFFLDNEDEDMGTAPVVFDLPGSTPGHLAVIFGKDGNAYLLDRNNLGGVGSALGANTSACSPTNNIACATLPVATAQIISAPALYTTATATYVAFRGNGSLCTGGTTGSLTTLKIVPGSPPALAASWCATTGTGSPMVTTSNGTADPIVWDLGAETDGHLSAFDGDTGAPISFTGSAATIAGMRRYNTPIAAKGRIYVAATGKVVAFTL
jgi:hypothetical protein